MESKGTVLSFVAHFSFFLFHNVRIHTFQSIQSLELVRQISKKRLSLPTWNPNGAPSFAWKRRLVLRGWVPSKIESEVMAGFQAVVEGLLVQSRLVEVQT